MRSYVRATRNSRRASISLGMCDNHRNERWKWRSTYSERLRQQPRVPEGTRILEVQSLVVYTMRTLLAPAWCGRSSCTQSSDLSPDEGTWTRCVTLDIGSRRHSDSLRHFGNCSGSYSIEYMASRWEESRPRRGQRRETDRTPGNDIRVSPEDAARHRLRGFRVCRIGSNRAAALSWCSSVLQRPRIFCVLSPSSASIGCMKQLLRLRAQI